MPVNIDMTGEEYKSRPSKIPAGIHSAKVNLVMVKESQNIDENTNKPAKYFEWELLILGGESSGEKITVRTTAIKGKRWLLKQALESCGIKQVDGKYNFDLSELNNKVVLIKVELKPEEWTSKKDGKVRISEKSVVTAFMKSNEKEDKDEVFSGQF